MITITLSKLFPILGIAMLVTPLVVLIIAGICHEGWRNTMLAILSVLALAGWIFLALWLVSWYR